MNPNKNTYSSNLKFIIPVLVVFILIILAIFLPKSKDDTTSEINNNPTQVEVIESGGTLPTSQGVENNKDNSNSPQQNPATVEDLGGNNTSSSGIDDLLKDKNIELKQ